MCYHQPDCLIFVAQKVSEKHILTCLCLNWHVRVIQFSLKFPLPISLWLFIHGNCYHSNERKERQLRVLMHMPELPPVRRIAGRHVTQQVWEFWLVSSALMRPQEVNDKSPQPLIVTTVGRLLSWRQSGGNVTEPNRFCILSWQLLIWLHYFACPDINTQFFNSIF